MKRGYIILLITSLLLILITSFNCFFNFLNNYTLIFFLSISLIFIYRFIGFEKDKQRYKKDIILMIVIISIIYLIITYIIGLFVGFNKTGYSLSFLSILKNIIPVIFILIISEFIRYMLVIKSSKYKLIMILIIISFVLIDITLLVANYDFNIGNDIMKFVLSILIPSISKNIMLTYLTFKVGYKTTLTYRFIFEIPMYFLPIFPDFGIYIESILKIIFPAFLAYIVFHSFDKLKKKEVISRPKKNSKIIALIIVSIAMLIIIIFTSGLFKYYALTIGSGSMTPNINKGDVIIVKKLNKKEKNNLKKGQILVFNHNKKVIVHRIIKIIQIDRQSYYYTKGDNNNDEDGYPIKEKDIIGKSSSRIRYIGYPTVLIYELVN